MTELQTVSDFKKYLEKAVDPKILVYYQDGALYEQTLRDNVNAYKRWKLKLQIFRPVSFGYYDTSVTVFGTKFPFPIGISPTAAQRMIHHDGEIGTAKAGADTNSITILSHYSTTALEDIAKASPMTHLWQQFYYYPKHMDYAKYFVSKINKYCRAIVVTIDTPVPGLRKGEINQDVFVLDPSVNYENFHGSHKGVPVAQLEEKLAGGVVLTWDHLKWLKKHVTVPLVVKGIMTTEDAQIALDIGVDAIMVSNHGGRQLDSCLATIDALPEIVRKVNKRCPVFIDGGIRCGGDVFKAIALGADMAFMGRPIQWGLAYDGRAGVRKVIKIVQNELEMAMAMTGCERLQDITREKVILRVPKANL